MRSWFFSILSLSLSLEGCTRCGDGVLEPGELCYQSVSSFETINAETIQAGDLDGDADPDLITSTRNTLQLSQNQGDGIFTPLPNIALSGDGRVVAIADLDGDSDQDLAVAEVNAVGLFFNDGAANFTPGPNLIGATNAFSAIVAEDLDGDNDLDLVTSTTDETLQLFLNDSAGAFAAPVVLPTGLGVSFAPTLELRDFNGDQRPDILVNDGSFAVAVLANQGDGSFSSLGVASLLTERAEPPAGFELDSIEFESLKVGDLDGDGDEDLLASQRGTFQNLSNEDDVQFFGAFLIARNDGTGTLTPEELPNEFGFDDGALGDLDNDNDLDVLIAEDKMQVLTNDGGVLSLGPEFDPDRKRKTSSAGQLLLADFNNDARLDFAVLSTNLVTISLFGE
jgi:FG-GAP-like repeat